MGKSLLFPLVFSTGTFEASILRRIRQPEGEPGSSFSVPTLEKFQGSNGQRNHSHLAINGLIIIVQFSFCGVDVEIENCS